MYYFIKLHENLHTSKTKYFLFHYKKVYKYFIFKKNKWYPQQRLFDDLKHAVISYILNTLNTIVYSQIELKFDANAK